MPAHLRAQLQDFFSWRHCTTLARERGATREDCCAPESFGADFPARAIGARTCAACRAIRLHRAVHASPTYEGCWFFDMRRAHYS
jgi:hypothetical protein